MIDLSVGGISWNGWHFGRWGKAREWRIFSPDETNYTAGEIINLRLSMLDLDYLRQRVRELEDYAAADAMHFGPVDVRALVTAADIVLRAAAQCRSRFLRARR